MALGDAPGNLVLHIYHDTSGMNSVHQRNISADRITPIKTEIIPVSTGDNFCADNKLEQIHFLKIDTEGHEIPVLLGFKEMFASQKIGIVQFEYGGTWIDSKHYLHEAFDFFHNAGYQVAKVFPDHIRKLENYGQSMECFRYANFVGLNRESAELLRTQGVLR